MYTAAVLERNSQLLLQYATRKAIDWVDFDSAMLMATPRGDELPHHMTINLGKFDENLNSKDLLHKNCKLYVQNLTINEKMGVVAAKVRKAATDEHENVETFNVVPHITIALRKGVPPKKSNDMLESSSEDNRVVYLTEELALDAYIQEC